MDLKDWKITSADGKKANLTHKDGHFMSIALKSLSKIQQQQIQRLAKGGQVGEKAINTGYTNDGTSKAGAMVRDGDMAMAKTHAKSTLKQMKADKGDRKNLADGGSIGLDPTKAQDFQAGFKQALGTPKPQPTPTPAPPPTPKPQNYDEGTPDGTVQQAPQPAQNADSILLPDQTLNAPAAVNIGEKAIGQQQAVDAAKAQATVPVEQQATRSLQNVGIGGANDLILKPYQELKGHTDDFNNYVQQHDINPTAYTDTAKANHKTSTAIGLMLGGMAGQGHGNVAMDYINKQIDRDIDAQKANINNRHTVLGAYQDLYKDSTVAANLARISTNDIYSHRINKIAAQLGTQQAEAIANAAKAHFGIQNNALLLQTAGRLNTINAGGGGGSAPTQTQENGQQQPMGPDQPGQPQMPVTPPGGSSMMMHKGADQGFQSFLYGAEGNPAMKQLVPELTDQYNKVRQAEKGLKVVDNVFPALTHEANFGQWVAGHMPSVSSVGSAAGGALLDHVLTAGKVAGGVGTAGALAAAAAAFGPEALAAAGVTAAAGGASGLAQKGWEGAWDKVNQTRQYLSDKSQLYGAVSSALRGVNIAPHKIEEIVDDNTPMWKDDAKTIEKKARTVKDFIKSHQSTSLLKLKGLTDD